ncbi:MAG: adenylate/guanylate cyclase domain-containing protein, partial [Ferruginibacter sp.]
GFCQPKGGKKNYSEDTAKVNSLIQQGKAFFTSDPARAINLADEARHLAQQADFADGEAYALKNMAITNYFQGKYPEALDYYNQSLNIFIGNKNVVGMANIYSNIGVIYYDQGDDAKALENYLKALKYAELSGDKLRMLTTLNNVGGVYNQREATYDKALEYYLKALPICEELGKKNELGAIAVNIGSIYTEKYIKQKTPEFFKKAMSYFNMALTAYGNEEGSLNAFNAIGKLYLAQGKDELALYNNNKAYELAKKLNVKISIVQSLRGLGNVYVHKKDYQQAINYYKEAEPLAKEIKANNELKDLYIQMATAYENMGLFKDAFQYQALFSSIKDTLYNAETDKKLGGLQFDFDMQKKQGEINLLTKDIALNALLLNRQKMVRNTFAVILVMVLLVTLLFFRNYREKIKTNKILDQQKVQIENLLVNILPIEVAKELRIYGQATSRHYESVPVMFTDFMNFTTHADKISPQELVQELNASFIAFDNIIEKNGLEKIKTIGDAYMCAGGIPTEDKNCVYNIVKASLEIQEFIVSNNQRLSEAGREPWDLRIGIHVGPVVAGVVGRKKYAYDIWGSTVNIASRMESNGAAGQVNISAATYEFVKDHFECEYRGKIYAKNIGEIDMYFVIKETVVGEVPVIAEPNAIVNSEFLQDSFNLTGLTGAAS